MILIIIVIIIIGTTRPHNLGWTTRTSDSQQQKKRTCWIVNFAVLADPRVKIKENEKRDMSRTCRELKTMDHEGDGNTNCNWCTWNNLQKIGKSGNQRLSGDHPDYSIIKTGQNIEKSPGDLRRLAIPQIPGKAHQLTLAWKTLKGVK